VGRKGKKITTLIGGLLPVSRDHLRCFHKEEKKRKIEKKDWEVLAGGMKGKQQRNRAEHGETLLRGNAKKKWEPEPGSEGKGSFTC